MGDFAIGRLGRQCGAVLEASCLEQGGVAISLRCVQRPILWSVIADPLPVELPTRNPLAPGALACVRGVYINQMPRIDRKCGKTAGLSVVDMVGRKLRRDVSQSRGSRAQGIAPIIPADLVGFSTRSRSAHQKMTVLSF